MFENKKNWSNKNQKNTQKPMFAVPVLLFTCPSFLPFERFEIVVYFRLDYLLLFSNIAVHRVQIYIKFIYSKLRSIHFSTNFNFSGDFSKFVTDFTLRRNWFPFSPISLIFFRLYLAFCFVGFGYFIRFDLMHIWIIWMILQANTTL